MKLIEKLFNKETKLSPDEVYRENKKKLFEQLNLNLNSINPIGDLIMDNKVEILLNKNNSKIESFYLNSYRTECGFNHINNVCLRVDDFDETNLTDIIIKIDNIDFVDDVLVRLNNLTKCGVNIEVGFLVQVKYLGQFNLIIRNYDE